MAHNTSKSYFNLQQRLDRAPQGAPASDTLFKILEILFSEQEADLVSKLPINIFSLDKAAKIWKKSPEESMKILDGLADKGIMVDIADGKTKRYVLAPTMAGFFEFSIMRTDGKFDRKLLSKLFHQYINEEDRFLQEVLSLQPNIARTFVQEDALDEEVKMVILDYERASKVIDTATCITVGTCYCRHKMEHMGKACDMPQDVCLTFNNCAQSLSNHGIARQIEKKEAHSILQKCINLGLVQIGDNVQENVSFICNCCSCCCEALLAYKRLGTMPKINSDYQPVVNNEKCTGCGLCTIKCPVDAIEFDSSNKNIQIDIEKCIGCGVCKRFCTAHAITMIRRKKTKFVPKDSLERIVLSAIHKGKLQNLIFDNHHLWTYDLLRKFLGVILNLPPAKKFLANQQLQSRFIRGFSGIYHKIVNKQT